MIMIKNMTVSGDKIRKEIAKSYKKQKDIAEIIGVTTYQVSRWCKPGERRVKKENILKLAQALGLSREEFERRVAVGEPQGEEEILSEMESEWLHFYRKLSPLEKAKVRVAVEKIIRGEEKV